MSGEQELQERMDRMREEANARAALGNQEAQKRIDEGNDFVRSVIGETPSSQNDIDLNKYEETLVPQSVSNLQPGEVAPSIVVAKEKSSPSFADKMWKGNAARYNEFQNTGVSSQGNLSITEDSPIYKNYVEEKKEIAHTDAVTSNTKASEGMKPLTPISTTGQDFFARQQEIANSAKKEAVHTEVVNNNTNANSGMMPLQHSEETTNALGRLDQMSKDLKLQAENEANQAQTVEEMKAKNAKYEEARRSNEEANKGFTADHFSGTEALAAQNEIVKGLREDMSSTESKNDQTEYTESLKADNAKLLERVHDLEIKLDALLSKLQLLETTAPATQIDGEEPVTTVQEPQPVVENTPQMNNATFVNINQQPPVAESTNPQIIDGQFEETPENTQPVSNPTFAGTTQQQTFEQQAPTNQDDRVAELEAQLRELRGENTPEQRSAALGSEISRLEAKLQSEGLTDKEKIRYFDLTLEKRNVDAGINQVEAENTKKRIRKERIIKIVAGVAGAGLALATPAVGVAAIVAVTLGGKFVGDGIKKVSNNLRSKSTSLKYESRQGKTIAELNEIDKKIKRKEWWANRLGEASAVVIGGSIGYGLGSTFQNIFGWGTGSAGTVTNTPSDLPGQASVSHAPTTGQGSIELPQGVGGSGIETQGQGVLVDGGRVNLPGSAWNGNLAQGPAQDILQGGALNHSNYNGGIHEMAAHTLEDALVKNGVTRPELMENLNTSQVHQLLNRYLEATRGGNVNPDLAQMLNSVKPGVAETLLK